MKDSRFVMSSSEVGVVETNGRVKEKICLYCFHIQINQNSNTTTNQNNMKPLTSRQMECVRVCVVYIRIRDFVHNCTFLCYPSNYYDQYNSRYVCVVPFLPVRQEKS